MVIFAKYAFDERSLSDSTVNQQVHAPDASERHNAGHFLFRILSGTQGTRPGIDIFSDILDLRLNNTPKTKLVT